MPADLFGGTLLVLVPHMDDGVLGCGATLAALPDPGRVHVLYATDGRGSFKSVIPTSGGIPGRDIAEVRADEARRAMGRLGVPAEHLEFLNMPDGTLMRRRDELAAAIEARLERVSPRTVLAPFRYDWHPDHRGLFRAACDALAGRAEGAGLLEYFVYAHRRLWPGGDIRRAVRAEYLVTVDSGPQRAVKAEALACFESQVTVFYPGQTRPVIGPRLLERALGDPEMFLRAGGRPEREIFAVPPVLVRGVDRVEPWLKNTRTALRFRLKHFFPLRRQAPRGAG